METSFLWAALREPGLEHLTLVEDEAGAVADGLVLGVEDGTPYRFWYQIAVDHAWHVTACTCQVGVGPAAHRRRWWTVAPGRWAEMSAGERLPDLDDCLDVDITCTPFTNTLPIRRLALQPGGSVEIQVAYIDVPSLDVRPTRQRYTCLERTDAGGRYRYEGLETGFTRDITVDARALVLDYPGLWRRVE